MAGSQDKYSNVLFTEVTESAANTLTFKQIDIGIGVFEKIGLKISRIEYFKYHTQLAADSDAIEFGLSQSNSWSAVDAGESSIITFHLERIRAIGTAATALRDSNPLVDDFTGLPEGGILVVPRPLYLFASGANLSSAATVQVRIFFTTVKLQPQEYFELLEARQYFG